MTDRHAYLAAVAVWLAAFVPIGESGWVRAVAVVSLLGVIRRRQVAMMVLCAVVASSVSAGHAWASLPAPHEGAWSGVVVLRTDPEHMTGGIKVVADVDGARVELRAWGSAAGRLRNRLMGERVELTATIRPDPAAPRWVRARGIVARGTVAAVAGFDVGSPHTRLANSLRRTIVSGTEPLTRAERSLFTGLVFGDDREQTALVTDNFKSAGLTHLLAVSGQNVAFTLTICAPILRRCTVLQRFALTLGVLVIFATITRFEASVIRASVMAAIAALGVAIGTELSSKRVLSLTVAGLILVDPLIAHSVAFQLSVAASAGILFWSARIALAIPGPRAIAEAISVTSAAQLAVSPLLVVLFGGLPVASLPANVLAGPAAGPVMMWGLTAGLFAGFVPTLAWIIQLPTRLAIWWIDSIGAVAPRIPLGELTTPHLIWIGLATLIAVRSAQRLRRAAAVGVIVAALVQPAIGLALAAPQSNDLTEGASMLHTERGTVIVVSSTANASRLLESLRRSGVSGIELVIAIDTSYAVRQNVLWLADRYGTFELWAPDTSMGIGETVPDRSQRITSGETVVAVVPDDGNTLTLVDVDVVGAS